VLEIPDGVLSSPLIQNYVIFDSVDQWGTVHRFVQDSVEGIHMLVRLGAVQDNRFVEQFHNESQLAFKSCYHIFCPNSAMELFIRKQHFFRKPRNVDFFVICNVLYSHTCS
jgi:hypothetical protein